MDNEQAENKSLHTLISLEEFKSVLGTDDREDKLSRFCLVTSTLTIESYCKRRLLRKKYFEVIDFFGDLQITLKEYPVSEVLGVFMFGSGEILEPDFYDVIPDCGTDDDITFTIEFSPAVARLGYKAYKAVYLAGYKINDDQLPVPADLSAACLELASWNFNRYKTKRIGMSGNIKGSGIQGEHFELSMPENVKILLEPYRRKTI